MGIAKKMKIKKTTRILPRDDVPPPKLGGLIFNDEDGPRLASPDGSGGVVGCWLLSAVNGCSGAVGEEAGSEAGKGGRESAWEGGVLFVSSEIVDSWEDSGLF